jgi:hypothetical protein
LAAMKIYEASCAGYRIDPARFHYSIEVALEHVLKLAKKEAAQARG